MKGVENDQQVMISQQVSTRLPADAERRNKVLSAYKDMDMPV